MKKIKILPRAIGALLVNNGNNAEQCNLFRVSNRAKTAVHVSSRIYRKDVLFLGGLQKRNSVKFAIIFLTATCGGGGALVRKFAISLLICRHALLAPFIEFRPLSKKNFHAMQQAFWTQTWLSSLSPCGNCLSHPMHITPPL